MFNHKPHLEYLRSFGCLCHVSTSSVGRDKIMPRSTSCVFLGYQIGKKGYKCLDIQTKEILISRDVKFFENIYPLKSFRQQDFSNSPSFLPINSTESEPITSPSSNNQSDPPLRRTTRPSHPPTYLNDFVCNHVNSNLCPHIVTNLSFDESSHLSSISPPTSHVFHTITHPVEPAFYNQAQGQPEWEAAMKTELQALNLNHTWDIVKLPKGKKPVSCKWVYKIKQKADGSIERYKAGLVAKGFTQKHGIDFHETFSPVVKFTTIRSIVALEYTSI